MSGKIERINIANNQLASRLRLTGNLNALFIRLRALPNNTLNARLVRRAEIILDKLQAGRRLTAAELREFETLLREYSEKRRLSPADKKLVEAVSREIAEQRAAAEQAEARTAAPSSHLPRAGESQAANNSHDSLVRGQIVNGQRLELNINLHDLKVTHTLPLDRALELANKQSLTAQELLRAIPAETRGADRAVTSDLLTRLILSMVVDRLVRDILTTGRRLGEVTRESIDRMVKEINRELKQTVVEVRTRAEAEVRKDRDLNELAAEAAYDRKDNIVRVGIEGRLSRGEMVRVARELVNTRPADLLPRLMETAIRAIEARPQDRSEIIRFVSELFARDTTLAPELRTQGHSPRQVVVPSSQPNQQVALTNNAGWASEPVLAEIIRSLIVAPAPSSHLVRTGESQAASVDIAKTILSQAPAQALPVLISEHARISQAQANHPAKAPLAEVIREVANSEAGRQYVLTAYAKGETKALLASTEVGHQVVIQTVRTMLAEARVQERAAKSEAVSLEGKTQVERMVAISKQFAIANHAQLAGKELTIQSAGDFLRAVAQAEKVVRLIGPKRLGEIEKQIKQQQKKVTTSSDRMVPLNKAGKRRHQPVNPVRTVERRSALRQLIKESEQTRLALPGELFKVVAGYYAGLAGLSGLNDPKLVAPLNLAGKSEETRQNSVLKRILEVMESQMTRQANQVVRNPGKALPAASSLSSEIFVYGLVMRRVRAEIEKADEVIKKLRAQGKLGAIIKLVAKGDIETAIQQLDAELGLINPELIAIAA